MIIKWKGKNELPRDKPNQTKKKIPQPKWHTRVVEKPPVMLEASA